MANSDSSQYTLRYNEISGDLEFASGNVWTDTGIKASTGVSSFNTLTGAVTLAAGSNITLTPSGNTVTVASTGGGSSGTVQAYTPTITGVGTAANVAFFYKTDAVSVEVWGTFQCGTTAASTFSVTLPVSAFAAHLSTSFVDLGTIGAVDTGVATDILPFYDGSDVTKMYIRRTSNGSPGSLPSKEDGNQYNATDYVSVHISYPIA